MNQNVFSRKIGALALVASILTEPGWCAAPAVLPPSPLWRQSGVEGVVTRQALSAPAEMAFYRTPFGISALKDGLRSLKETAEGILWTDGAATVGRGTSHTEFLMPLTHRSIVRAKLQGLGVTVRNSWLFPTEYLEAMADSIGELHQSHFPQQLEIGWRWPLLGRLGQYVGYASRIELHPGLIFNPEEFVNVFEHELTHAIHQQTEEDPRWTRLRYLNWRNLADGRTVPGPLSVFPSAYALLRFEEFVPELRRVMKLYPADLDELAFNPVFRESMAIMDAIAPVRGDPSLVDRMRDLGLPINRGLLGAFVALLMAASTFQGSSVVAALSLVAVLATITMFRMRTRWMNAPRAAHPSEREGQILAERHHRKIGMVLLLKSAGMIVLAGVMTVFHSGVALWLTLGGLAMVVLAETALTIVTSLLLRWFGKWIYTGPPETALGSRFRRLGIAAGLVLMFYSGLPRLNPENISTIIQRLPSAVADSIQSYSEFAGRLNNEINRFLTPTNRAPSPVPMRASIQLADPRVLPLEQPDKPTRKPLQFYVETLLPIASAGITLGDVQMNSHMAHIRNEVVGFRSYRSLRIAIYGPPGMKIRSIKGDSNLFVMPASGKLEFSTHDFKLYDSFIEVPNFDRAARNGTPQMPGGVQIIKAGMYVWPRTLEEYFSLMRVQHPDINRGLTNIKVVSLIEVEERDPAQTVIPKTPVADTQATPPPQPRPLLIAL